METLHWARILRVVSVMHVWTGGAGSIHRWTLRWPSPTGRSGRVGGRRSGPSPGRGRGTCRPGVRRCRASRRRRVHAGADLGQDERRAGRDVRGCRGRSSPSLEVLAPAARSRCARRAASAAASAVAQATMAAAAGVETDHGVCARRSSATTSGVGRAGSRPGSRGSPQCLVRLRTTTQPGRGGRGQRLGLAGHGVHERLVDDDQPARAGPGRGSRRPGAGRRSGWSGCRPPPGRRRPGRRRVEREAVSGSQRTSVDRGARPARARRAAR